MRSLLVFVLAALALAVAPLGHAQGDNSTTNATSANSTATGNATSGNGTADNTTTTPAAPQPIEISLEGHGDNGEFFWTLAGQSAHNPTITVQPGQQVTFHVKSVSSIHNFKVGDLGPTKAISEGDEVDVQWTAPTTPGTVTYICTIHGSIMSGRIQVGSPSNGGGGGGGASGSFTGTIAGDTVNLGDVANDPNLPDNCKTMKIPAQVATKTNDPNGHITGGPTIPDYIKWCESGGNTARPASGADYVIPISFAAIGLGVVGLVWAHRAYHP